MIDDTTLLRRYAAERAEDAFAEFVRRHVSLVYSAALRRLDGDTQRAEDVVQEVFCAVARDAQRLSQHAVLTGWLYTATRNAVIDLMRAEKRRRAREKEAHLVQETSRSDAATDWSRLRPVLDAAMDELSGTDREAVLLRFFQDRPFAEIGATLGLSEDTARKRVERALDKLQTKLRRHGIDSTSTALATLLAGESICAAPAGLTASVTAAAVAASAAKVGALALVTVSKLQIGIAALAIAGGAVGLVTQQRTIQELRDHTATTQQQLARLATENAALAAVRNDPNTNATPVRPRPAALKKPETGPTAPGGTMPKAGRLPNRPAGLTGAVPGRIETNPADLGPLPDTAEIRKQKAYGHERYDDFFRQRELTPAQGDRFVELKIHQSIRRAAFQSAVQKANLRGDSQDVQALRAEDDRPVTRELMAMLGDDGYAAYVKYEKSSMYRMSFVAPLQRQFSAANMPLLPDQAEKLVVIFRASARSSHAKSTDIGSTVSMDWEAVNEKAGGILAPPQLVALQTYAEQKNHGGKRPR
jgi:RNA polymerase sigma factor (sigma-70 family)